MKIGGGGIFRGIIITNIIIIILTPSQMESIFCIDSSFGQIIYLCFYLLLNKTDSRQYFLLLDQDFLSTMTHFWKYIILDCHLSLDNAVLFECFWFQIKGEIYCLVIIVFFVGFRCTLSNIKHRHLLILNFKAKVLKSIDCDIFVLA